MHFTNLDCWIQTAAKKHKTWIINNDNIIIWSGFNFILLLFDWAKWVRMESFNFNNTLEIGKFEGVEYDLRTCQLIWRQIGLLAHLCVKAENNKHSSGCDLTDWWTSWTSPPQIFCPSTFTLASTLNNSTSDSSLWRITISVTAKPNKTVVYGFSMSYSMVFFLLDSANHLLFQQTSPWSVDLYLFSTELLFPCASSFATCYEVMSAKNYHLAPSPSGLQPLHLVPISLRNRRWPCLPPETRNECTACGHRRLLYNPCTHTDPHGP